MSSHAKASSAGSTSEGWGDLGPSRRNALFARLGIVLAATLALLALPGIALSPALGASCPNEALRTGFGALLPDCRAYEQASPVDKLGGNVIWGENAVQASANGDRVLFADNSNLPTTGGASSISSFVASLAAGHWSTDGILPLTPAGYSATLAGLGWSSDLSTSAALEFAGPAPGLYLRDTATGTQELAVPGENITPEVAGFAAVDKRHLVFQSESALVSDAIAGQRNLYDFDDGALTLASRVPVFPATSCDDAVGPACVGSASGAVAGPYNWIGGNLNGGGPTVLFTPESISADGSKVFFTQRGTARLYMREDAIRTVQVSVTQRTVPDPNGEKGAGFVAATPSGSEVFFLSCEKLTDDSTAVSTAPSKVCNDVNTQGQDLYAYDTASGDLTDLTVDVNAGDPFGAQVVGVVGASADGDDVYFVANGVLAPGAAAGNCTIAPGDSVSGACSLYLVHREGSSPSMTTFIARFLPGALTREARNWTPEKEKRLSRVSTDGTIVFTSAQKLTAYDNHGVRELYRFASGDTGPTCVSCNPSGAAPVNEASLQSPVYLTAVIPPSFFGFVTRNISPDGGQVFFETPDKLVPADVNGDQVCPQIGIESAGKIPACTDVYEWEAVGEGGCTVASPAFSAPNNGCLYLLSTGTSTFPSFFGDASVSGDDAFIFTSQSLVPQDKDQLIDVYDASVGGGLAYQHATPAVPCEGEGCRGPGSNPANNPGAGSTTFQGPGNPKANRQKKKRKHHRKKRQHKRAHSHKRANANQGGGK